MVFASVNSLASALVTVAACARGAASQAAVTFDSATASSVYPSGAFAAEDATRAGSGYWCSAGSHSPGHRVTWTGAVSTAQMATGVSINWAYGPGEFRVLTSSDGGNFEEAVGWRVATRQEVAYSESVMFQAPRRVKAVAVVMRSPKTWGFFGINNIAMLVEPGSSMLATSAGDCLVTMGSGLSVRKCTEAIVSGAGEEVFNMNEKSQLVSASTGKCVSLAKGRVGLQGCEAALDAGDDRSTFAVTPEGQLKCQSVGNYCLSASPAGAVAAPCSPTGEDGDVILTAVPEFDPSPRAHAQDVAALLQAAVVRQSALLQQLKAKSAACKSLARRNNSTEDQHSLVVLSTDVHASSAVGSTLDVELATAKALIAESQATLDSIAA